MTFDVGKEGRLTRKTTMTHKLKIFQFSDFLKAARVVRFFW